MLAAAMSWAVTIVLVATSVLTVTVSAQEGSATGGEQGSAAAVGAAPPSSVKAVAPTVTDAACGGSGGSIDITAVPGVDYYIDDGTTPASPGPNVLAPGSHRVTAQAQPGFVLAGDTRWKREITQRDCQVAPVVASEPEPKSEEPKAEPKAEELKAEEPQALKDEKVAPEPEPAPAEEPKAEPKAEAKPVAESEPLMEVGASKETKSAPVVETQPIVEPAPGPVVEQVAQAESKAVPAAAKEKPPKEFSIFLDKNGVYACISGNPKGQTKVAGPWPDQATCQSKLTTPPTIDYLLSPASPDGQSGWYTSNVLLSWTVIDPVGYSGSAAMVKTGCVSPTNIAADQAPTDYSCSASTPSGSAGPVTVSIKRDGTKPGIDWSGSIADGDTFFADYDVPAVPTCSATDALSGPNACDVTGYSAAVGSHTLTATAKDVAGNTQTSSRTYTVVQPLAPTIDFVRAPANPDGTNGWYTVDVSLTWTVADPTVPKTGTLQKTGCADQSITADQGAQTYSCSASTIGGSTGPIDVPIKRDATKPGLTWNGLINEGDSFYAGAVPVEPTCSASDALSGPDGCTVSGYGAAAGPHTLTATALDMAGNETVETRSYTVVHADAPIVVGVLDPAAPDGLALWYKGNVSLTWTASDPSDTGTLQTTDCVDQSITADQGATTYSCSATTIGGTTAVDVSIKRDARAPDVFWNGDILDGDTFFFGSVPAQPLCRAIDALSGDGGCAVAGYETTIGNHSLTATAFDVAGNQTTETRSYTVTLIPVTVEAPSATDQSCNAGTTVPGTLTIPAVTGVDYFVDGIPTAAGTTNQAADTYAVTATARAGYELTGYPVDGWSLTIAPVTCQPPVQIEFVGRTLGPQATSSIALPAGWQAGDLAVLITMRNACGYGTPVVTCPPPIPTGFTTWGNTLTSGPVYPNGTTGVSSRLSYRVLQAGDTGTVSTGSYRWALVMVYRHAAPGVVGQLGGTTTTLTVPGLTLQQTNGSSWVGATVANFAGLSAATAPTGMVSRTSGGGNGPGGFDTNGGVTAWTSKTMTVGAPWNAFSFELKLVP
jgi:hypothetical protein